MAATALSVVLMQRIPTRTKQVNRMIKNRLVRFEKQGMMGVTNHLVDIIESHSEHEVSQ